jgi:hypothetical protein
MITYLGLINYINQRLVYHFNQIYFYNRGNFFILKSILQDNFCEKDGYI